MKLYIYSNETNEHVATITGETNEACEAKAEELYSSNDYSNTYSPAFGFSGGLIENGNAGEMPITEWRDRLHTVKDLNYQNGRLYSAWGKSIIEPGKLERLAFELR